ncbi:MAG: T9SS type A sorting domain-containing protein [Vicingaceae bacterium]
MKKILFTSSLLVLVFLGMVKSSSAQPVTIFYESFDTIPSLWNMTRSWVPANQTNRWYRDTVITKDRSRGSATDTINTSGPNFTAQTHLTSPQIYIGAPYTSIGFSFDQICYVGIDNDATVQYSFDNGATWTRFPPSAYSGGSVYDWGQGDYKFCKASRANEWRISDTAYIWPASTKAWIRENFDATDVIVSSGTTSDSMRIRFTLINDPSAPRGRVGTHRWIVDNFEVRGADCELVPPTLDLLDPPRNYPARYEGRVYSEGPYDFDAKILDQSGVDTAYIVAWLKRDVATPPAAPQWDTIARDTFPMKRLSGGNFEGKITSPIDGTPIQLADTIIWKVVAIDRSDCKNETQDPPSGFTSFRVVNDLPKSCNTQPVYQYPYYQTFNSTNFQPSQKEFLAESWENVEGDFHDWWINAGPTETDSTGPSDGFPAGGNYLYVESTGYPDSSAYLITPCFDLSDEELDNGLVRFYINMNTNSIDDIINVDIYDPNKPGSPFGGFVNNVIPPIRGNKGDNWIPFEFSAYPYRNTVTQLRFRGTPGTNSGFGDMAIDSFKIVEGVPVDVRMNPIDLPPYGPAGEEDSLMVNVQNLGISDATNITFFYQVCSKNGTNCTTPESILWSGTLAAAEPPRDIKLPVAYPILKGDYFLKVWLVLNGDLVPANDTAFSNSRGLAYQGLKYRDNFDEDTLWSSLTESNPLVNSWELGQPNFARTNNLISAPNAWDVLLNRPYTGTGITNSLVSPILDFRNADSIIISFLNNRDIDTTKDGVWLEWSLDRGRTWNYLENFDDVGSIRWYNNTLSSGGLGGTPVFADRTSCYANTWGPGWLESELYLPDTLDNEARVMLRFNFFAEDDEDGNAGMSIDNFLIYDPTPLDVEPQYMLSPNSKCSMSSQTRINTIFKNRGLETVNSFDVEYRITHLPTNTVESKTDLVNRTFDHRDTVHVLSASTFNFFELGDYKVEVITKLPGDGCLINDTLTNFVENIDGCSLRFVIETSFRRNFQAKCDSSVWRFNYTSGDRDYQVSGAYNDPKYAIGKLPNVPGDTITDLFVCIKTGSEVRFDLNDIDTLVEKYSFIAYNGERDTLIREDITGGPDSPTQYFNWNCPPERSATPIEILFDDRKIQIPVAKDYAIEAFVLNNGLDSLDDVQAFLQIDDQAPLQNNVLFSTPLRYNRSRRVSWPNQFLTPGVHEICVWTTLPNGQQDLLPEDDTLCVMMTIMDTIKTLPFCDNFDSDSGFFWPSLNTYNYNQQESDFELGTPSTPNLSGANSGLNAWTTRLNSNYPLTDSSSIISPFLLMEKDSCYEISFNHNYYITDSLQDGGQVQYTDDNGISWKTIGNHLGDSALFGQIGWYNTLHIISMPDNQSNSGWTGVSNGWKSAKNVIGSTEEQYVALRWRFESDASSNSDGWAIDDVCIKVLDSSGCLPVGLAENNFDENKFYLGQNIPNPANLSTSIPYYLPHSGEIQFTLSNLLGQQIYMQEMDREKGDGIIELDLADVAKGIYFYTLTFDGERQSNKMIVVK